MTTGPSTSTAPYLLASEPNVRLVSILTTGDSIGGNVFGGIPDGIGAYDNGDGTITILVNHEYGPTAGVVQDHGSTGAYVDRVVVDAATLEVISTEDLIQSVQLWNDATDSYFAGTTAFNRFCSSDLPAESAFFDAGSGLGTTARIYLTGEEAGAEGRGFAIIAEGPGAGTAYELPFLGNLSFENIVANPYAQASTVVAVTDDTGGGQVYIYVGEKQSTGSTIERAGLSGGDLYGIKVTTLLNESDASAADGRFSLELIGNASNLTGAQMEIASDSQGVTGFLRPEDLAWDPDNPEVAYFVTTNEFNHPTRLYRITFDDITNPAAGGDIEMVIDGSDYGAQMFDNLSVANGKVIVQEDPGNQNYLARIWEYDIATGSFYDLAHFDPAYFTPGSADFITRDEESSGVIDVTDLLGDADSRAYVIDAQVHANTGNPLTVQPGQLLVMYVDDPRLTGGNGSDDLFGSAADEQLSGGNGGDVLRAGGGDDSVSGGNGNDLLVGGAGDDVLTGGNGADYFIFDNSADTGSDRITDFTAADRILTTVQLADGDGDGVISFPDGDLDLSGSSSVEINGGAVTAVRYAGTVTLDGATFYSYALDSVHGGGHPGHSVFTGGHFDQLV